MAAAPFGAADGVVPGVRVEITARNQAGFPDGKIRTIIKNARTLRLETYGFEDM